MFDAGCRSDVARPLEAGLVAALRSGVVPRPAVVLRAGALADLGALESLERRAFAHDRIARRSFVRFLNAPNVSLIVADGDGAVCGYALVLSRARSRLARLYSLAVDAQHAGRQLGSTLLRAAEDAAQARGSRAMRLEVCESNAAAINLYRKFGYELVNRLPGYYGDGSNALRLEKGLSR